MLRNNNNYNTRQNYYALCKSKNVLNTFEQTDKKQRIESQVGAKWVL